ncbi:MAG: flagellar basal-body rod protein FlgG [Lachnospiraceae bacterium]
MMRSLWTAATGMIAQQTNVDTIANNISNVNTTGYKSERAEFKSLLYQTIQTRTTTANGETKPVGARAGLGTRVAAIKSEYTNGALLSTESDTDFAIQGDGFFQVDLGNGQRGYTRDGNFVWAMGPNGTTLCSTDGYQVLDTNGNPIILPANVDSSAVVVGSTGEFAYQNGDGSYTQMNQKIGLWQFNNPTGLEKDSQNILLETEASGQPLNEETGQGLVKSKVFQKYLEGSNVQVADEMVNLIVAQRAYELNSKAITTSDEMMQQANNLKR